MYANGQGVKGDYPEAFRWYRLAAEQGRSEAASNVGVMYANGLGITKDYVESLKWLTIAISEGDKDSVEARDKVAGRMTAQQIEKAKQMAAAWKPCHGKSNCDARVKQ